MHVEKTLLCYERLFSSWQQHPVHNDFQSSGFLGRHEIKMFCFLRKWFKGIQGSYCKAPNFSKVYVLNCAFKDAVIIHILTDMKLVGHRWRYESTKARWFFGLKALQSSVSTTVPMYRDKSVPRVAYITQNKPF